MTAAIWRRLTTAVLVVYWVALAVGTHLPRAPIIPFQQGDKLMHAAAYAVLAMLAGVCWSAWRGPLCRRELTLLVTVLAIYAALDELTQIPVGRDGDWRDWLADVFGVTCGIAALLLLQLMRNRRTKSVPPA